MSSRPFVTDTFKVGFHGEHGEGERFGPYRIERRIATGGMAEIFLAKQQTLEGVERPVVLKRILPDFNRNEEFITMFLDEARLLASVSHPNIAQAFDLGQLGEAYYLVMEYVRGPTLNNLLRSTERQSGNPLPLKAALGITLGIAEALAYVHECRDEFGRPLQIVHRDLNPANVIVSYDGAVKLIDFGIAKAATKVHQTRTEVVKGTYGYIAPEQLTHSEPVDHRADVYGLGVLLYEMLVGVHPFDAPHMLKIVEAMMRGDFIPPAQRVPGLPASLNTLVCRCLAKQPADRPQSVRALIKELVEVMAAHAAVCTMGDLSALARSLVPDKEGPAPMKALQSQARVFVGTMEAQSTMPFVAGRESDAPTMAKAAPVLGDAAVASTESAGPSLPAVAATVDPDDDAEATRAAPLVPSRSDRPSASPQSADDDEIVTAGAPRRRNSKTPLLREPLPPLVAAAPLAKRSRVGPWLALVIVACALSAAGYWYATRDKPAASAEVAAPETLDIRDMLGSYEAEAPKGESAPGAPEAAGAAKEVTAEEAEPAPAPPPEAPEQAEPEVKAKRTVRLLANKRGARIYLGETSLGVAPLRTQLVDETLTLVAKRRGFRDVRMELEPGAKRLYFKFRKRARRQRRR